ncbi:tripartite tricarboxylate transporter TctB family protein [Metabacillus idriensis]|uniref:tripartite tricarboxylate transporter TctB family protein n=1 Tax=Metabacillus idriensis TaxID=324768 RepID=UPI003D2E4ADF
MKINKEFLLGGIVLAIGIFFVIESYRLPPGDHLLNSARSFPMLLGSCLILLSIWQLILARTKNEKAEKRITSSVSMKRAFIFILNTLLYIFILMPLIGFLSATLVFLLVGLMAYKEVSWYTATLVSVGMVGFIYFVFEKLMYIRFP